MTVMITGGAGYIGSHMALRLLDAGEKVVVMDNLSTGFDWAIDGRADFVHGNVGDIELVGKTIAEYNVKDIIHFAGAIIVPESVEKPLKYYADNTATSRNLIEAAVKGGVERFIFSSTAAVYGMLGMDPADEENPLNPTSPYGRSKLMTEMMLADVAAATPLKYGVLRYFNVAGADPQGRAGQSGSVVTHLIRVAAQTALGQRAQMSVFGTDYETPDGTCVRDYIHVSDLTEAHGLLLDYLREGGESITLNCGYGRGYSVREVVDVVRDVSGVDFTAVEGPRRAGDPAAIVAKSDKARDLLKWEPKHEDLHEIVQSAVAWERHLMTRNR